MICDPFLTVIAPLKQLVTAILIEMKLLLVAIKSKDCSFVAEALLRYI
jgi:hypothetical protein